MEDAMIINKQAYERGFKHGCVYKSYIRELNESGIGASSKAKYRMVNQDTIKEDSHLPLEEKGLDVDGLPFIGK
jgi:DNA-directed RNA polymerase I subunit RPA2